MAAILTSVMKPKPAPGSDKNAPVSPATVRTLLLTMADTTWRIFVPATLFVGLGLWGDVSFGSKPWLTLLGVVIGFAAAGLLVRKQINIVKKL